MPDKFTAMNPALYEYLSAHRSGGDAIARELQAETEKLGPIAMMQIAPEQGTFMGLLTKAIGARNALEVGTFTGYSSISIARGLAPGGRLLCCDVSEEWTNVARRYWEKAGVASKIDLRIGPGLDTLRALPRQAHFDIAFIDADKTNYKNYYEEILPRLRPHGLILFDNVLWGGAVIDASNQSDDTVALRALNEHIVNDTRVESVMLSISDGLTIVRKL